MAEAVRFGVSDFVASVNQTLEFAYGSTVLVAGELANFRVSKNRWVYFDLKDAGASVRCFGTVYSLPGPLEDGMLIEVRAAPRLHALYGFSLQFASIRPVGEGSIKQAAKLLQQRLTAEGLFAPERKRVLPYPPRRIGLITSAQSAAYADFTKILQARWGGIHIMLADVQVQGEPAVRQLVAAIEHFSGQTELPEVVVIIRGGGSADDLAAFSAEPVVRAVAASRVPTLVAIGHETDVSLAELAADQSASTPSNAAERLVPDRRAVHTALEESAARMRRAVGGAITARRAQNTAALVRLYEQTQFVLRACGDRIERAAIMLRAYDPALVLKRGYAVVRDGKGEILRATTGMHDDDKIRVRLAGGSFEAAVEKGTIRS